VLAHSGTKRAVSIVEPLSATQFLRLTELTGHPLSTLHSRKQSPMHLADETHSQRGLALLAEAPFESVNCS
jgi:hypothetical protein